MLVTALAAACLLVIPGWRTVIAASTLSKPLLGVELLAVEPTVGVVSDKVGTFTSTAIEAKDDTPALYVDGCHKEVMAVEIVPIVYGNADSNITIAVVGDSQAPHCASAFMRLANEPVTHD